MILLMVPLVDIAKAFPRSMIGGETHWVNVSSEGENSHTLCTTCSKGSMGDGMATTTAPLFPYEVSHMMDVMPYDDDFQLIIYEMIWANMFHNVGGEILIGLISILSFEGNVIAAQDQCTLYTYPKWRGGQRGVGYFFYQYHIFYPPTLLEPKVDGSFQELPSWKVTHFAWLISWRWRIHMGKIVPISF